MTTTLTTLTIETTETLALSDAEFLEAFESCSIPPGQFHHRDHVRLAWLYLRRYPVTEVLGRFSEGLKRFASAVGADGLYHETITWAYVLLINQRMEHHGRDLEWGDFARRNPDLLTYDEPVLRRYYRDETLSSELARAVFVLPDRGEPEAAALR